MPDLTSLLGSLIPTGSLAGRPTAPGRRPGQDEADATTGSWEQSRGHRSQSSTSDALDD
jgi:hypothetical protein